MMKTKQKTGFSVGQHKRAGVKLKQVNDLLRVLYCELRKYNSHASRTVQSMRRAIKAIDTARSELDNRLFEEHPQVGYIEKCKTYYGRD